MDMQKTNKEHKKYSTLNLTTTLIQVTKL